MTYKRTKWNIYRKNIIKKSLAEIKSKLNTEEIKISLATNCSYISQCNHEQKSQLICLYFFPNVNISLFMTLTLKEYSDVIIRVGGNSYHLVALEL